MEDGDKLERYWSFPEISTYLHHAVRARTGHPDPCHSTALELQHAVCSLVPVRRRMSFLLRVSMPPFVGEKDTDPLMGFSHDRRFDRNALRTIVAWLPPKKSTTRP